MDLSVMVDYYLGPMVENIGFERPDAARRQASFLQQERDGKQSIWEGPSQERVERGHRFRRQPVCPELAELEGDAKSRIEAAFTRASPGLPS